MNILHISEQLGAAKAENNTAKAKEIIRRYLTAWEVEDPSETQATMITNVYFQYPQTALKTLEQYSI